MIFLGGANAYAAGVWDAVCSKTLRGLSQCFATFGTCVLVAERDLYSQRPANIKVVLN